MLKPLTLLLIVILSCIFLFNQYTLTNTHGVARKPTSFPKVKMELAFPKLPKFVRPLWMSQAPDGRWFLLEQGGKIHVFADKRDQEKTEIFLDLSAKVRRDNNEEGLLAFAFHPRFKDNGKFYLYYSVSEPVRTILTECSVDPKNPARADPKSERTLLEIRQPWGNHNGGTVLFGPDGYLYLSIGDGGYAGDPQDNGQNLKTLLASMIRIDVDKQAGDKLYAIPEDNPFVGQGEGVREEIWAYGLRNVWRMSFDRKTDELWAGDVGQNAWEEINIIEKGGNYGWRHREGKVAYNRSRADATDFIEPVAVYDRAAGLSVTGGYVYRGKKIKALIGAYLYADYVLGTIFSLRYDSKEKKLLQEGVLLRQPKNIASFAEDLNGEIYIICFDGKVYKLTEEK